MVCVIHAFMGFADPSVAYLSISGLVKGIVATTTRFDEVLDTTDTCLLVDGSEKAGGHRQLL